MNSIESLHDLATASDYDPNSMPVEKAREHIRALSIAGHRIRTPAIRSALGRVLAEDMISPVNVPQHDNSAMDGYAVRFDDHQNRWRTATTMIGTSFAGTPFAGQGRHRAKRVRIMTGGSVPSGADTRHSTGAWQNFPATR